MPCPSRATHHKSTSSSLPKLPSPRNESILASVSRRPFMVANSHNYYPMGDNSSLSFKIDRFSHIDRLFRGNRPCWGKKSLSFSWAYSFAVISGSSCRKTFSQIRMGQIVSQILPCSHPHHIILEQSWMPIYQDYFLDHKIQNFCGNFFLFCNP